MTVLVSGADARYGDWLLNLVGSLAKNDRLRDHVVLYDLGLTPFQRRLASSIRGIELRSIPTFAPNWQAGRTWKTWIWTHVDADAVIWLDAGLSVLRPLDELRRAIERDGYFAVSQGHPNRNAIPRDWAVEHGLTDVQLDQVQIAAGILGFRRDDAFYERVIVPTHEDCLRGLSLGFSPGEESLARGLDAHSPFVVRDCPHFRWDQSVLNLHFVRNVEQPVIHDLDRYAGWRSREDDPQQVIWSHRRRGDFAYLASVPYDARSAVLGNAWGLAYRWRWWARNHSWLFRPATYARKAKRVVRGRFAP
jgi:hypothetical protein